MVPGATCRETPSSARTAPYVVTTSSTARPSAVDTAHLPGRLVDVLSEVRLQHARVVLNLVRRAGRDDAAEVEHHDAVAHLHDEVHVVHHMDLVMQVCDRIVVLDFGRVIATGTPHEVKDDPRVLEAYLGENVDESTGEVGSVDG